MDPYSIPDRSLFSSTHTALKALGRLGAPSKAPDISHPNPQSRSALDIIAFLTYHNTTPWDEGAYFKNVVLKHWSTSIGPWYKYFYEEYILAEDPTTPTGLDFRDRMVWLLPSLLLFSNDPEERSHWTFILLRNQGRFLISLTAKAWFRLIETSHPATFKWTAFVLIICHSRDSELTGELEGIISFMTAEDVVGLTIREMSRFALLCRRSLVDFDKLSEFDMFMIILYPCFDPDSPLHVPFLARGGVRALVSVLSGLLSRSTLAKYQNNTEGFDTGITIVRLCFSLLKQCLEHPSSASEALEAGLLKVVVKGAEYYSDGTEMDTDDWERNFGDMVADVLGRISRLLVYPSVLLRFQKSITKYVTDEWVESVEENHKRIWEVWEACLDNVDCLGYIREILMDPDWSVCDYEECPNLDLDEENDQENDERNVIKYLRCSSCKGVVYCSRACAKKNWPQHKDDCLRSTQLQKAGTCTPGPIERAVFLEVVKEYVYTFHKDISERLEYFNAETRSKGDTNPVLFLEFEETDLELNFGHQLMESSCFDIVDREEILQDGRLLQTSKKRIIEEFASDSVSSDYSETLVTVAFFPSPWPLDVCPIVMSVRIPDGESGTDSDDGSTETEGKAGLEEVS
ncbi:hypothetical protein VNI00_005482 [Paramarasmius palmivorus]|uniref:MYND-type domain-containing protein n=1 Tax=Paramarasmius palmivorus TaxID=297713 RepID=A0AAW0DFE5_9AGAR